MYQHIRDNILRIKAEIPPHITVVAAAKTRNPDEISTAIDAGISVIGENYVQEAESARCSLVCRGEWHLIGHLQPNKVRKAVELFDLIETVDSDVLARSIDQHALALDKIMPVLIEVNIGRESRKNGVLPEFAADLARSIAGLPNLRLLGLMTMGPLVLPEELRPFFRATRRIYQDIQQMRLPNTDLRFLSMGMSDSYRVAIEEGATMVRLGTAIFGPRL